MENKNQMIIKEILTGISFGDAFGAGVEFQDRDWIRQNIDFTKFVNARNEIKIEESRKRLFTHNYTAWDYTDDTEMTIGTLKALLSDEDFTEQLLLQKWTEEYQKGMLQKGYGRNGHGSMAWYYSKEKTIQEIKNFQKNRSNPGNAPAMRAILIGFVQENLINTYAAINANATHPNINAILSSQCIARATEFILVKKGNPKFIVEYCQDKIKFNQEYSDYLEKINQIGDYENLTETQFTILCGTQPIEKPYFLAGIKGVPSDSKYTAGSVLYILKHSMNTFDALKKSIYLGGDVDSIASISTGILAGKTGLESLPKFMREKTEKITDLDEIAEKFALKFNHNS